jgi:hypothetical protein
LRWEDVLVALTVKGAEAVAEIRNPTRGVELRHREADERQRWRTRMLRGGFVGVHMVTRQTTAEEGVGGFYVTDREKD